MMVSGLFSYFGFRFCQRLTHDAESRQLIDLYLESHSSESQTHDAEWSLQLEGWIVMSDTFWLKCPCRALIRHLLITALKSGSIRSRINLIIMPGSVATGTLINELIRCTS